MKKPHWLQNLSRLGLEFWLPLPLIGLFFLLGTGWINHHVLSYTYKTTAQLQADYKQQIEFSASLTIRSIEAEIDRRGELTEVTVRTADSALQEMEFEFPVTEFTEVDAAIAKELGLTPESVRPLIRYRIDD
ncbi:MULTISPECIES: hypothetical protein [unclassified Coleofasciculus]|uniref:hypothetical protein n=1 Tax=unclassified Coleofasciculus TaxID=2692782 RepID=UPI001882F43A|nr:MULTISPECIES: hypothetical protein [unclassified Coleofasciculus]MBE9127794.1 hypothetical protein [Coleofasciculus sp. LEGE 07081]MBE9150035.1 hypothetical protein [Coleofasciculus sp. LEGE 07092]